MGFINTLMSISVEKTLPPKFVIKIKNLAQELGFELCRILPISSPRYALEFSDWIDKKFYADMQYMVKAKEVRLNPALLSPSPMSVVVLAKAYYHQPIPEKLFQDSKFKNYGIIANYALGINGKKNRDYHKELKPKLIAIDKMVAGVSKRQIPAKSWSDSGPVLERDFAEIAGIGFIGKNTCLINAQLGSWFFIATLWLPEKFSAEDYDCETTKTSRNNFNIINFVKTRNDVSTVSHMSIGSCGSCVRCLQKCPTQALTQTSPYILDANKCISYWTIEAKSSPPPALSKKFGNRIFGCDICQEVCPWNMNLPNEQNINLEDLIYPNGQLLLLTEGFNSQTPYLLDDEAFLEKFKGTAIMRAGRKKMLENINIAIQNMQFIK